MNITQRLDAFMTRCRERRGVIALLLLPLVFAGCASYNIKGAYLDAAEVGSTFPTTVSAVTQANLPISTKIAGHPLNLDILGGFQMTDQPRNQR